MYIHSSWHCMLHAHKFFYKGVGPRKHKLPMWITVPRKKGERGREGERERERERSKGYTNRELHVAVCTTGKISHTINTSSA